MTCFIVSFQSTTQAMMMQAVASREGLPGRIIPVPRRLSAGCGMAWAVPAESEGKIREAITSHDIKIAAAELMEYGLRSGFHGKRK